MAIVERIPAPTGDLNAPLRALIYDAKSDVHRGVIIHIRLVDGTVKRGDKIDLMASHRSHIVTEVGRHAPKPVALETLSAGEVGYLLASIKTVADVNIGDTVAHAKRPGGEPRPESVVARVGLAAAVASLLRLLTGIWGTPNSDAFWKSTAIVTILALVLAYLAVVDVQRGRLTRSFPVKAVTVAAIMACFGIAAGINWPPYWWVFTLAVMVWVGALAVPPVGYLGMRMVRRFQRR